MPNERGGRKHRKGNQTRKEEQPMAHHAPYADLSDAMQCAKDLVSSWRNGTMLTDKAATAKHLHTLLGFGLGATFGEPDHPLIGAAPMQAAGPALSEDQLMAELESFGNSDPQLMQAKAIPWPLILAALKMLLERLLKP